MESELGLSQQEAAEKLKNFGLNELPEKLSKNAFMVILKILKEPMIIILILISVIYLIMGDITDGILISSSAVMVVGLTLYQEKKSENALQALKDLSSPRALVIREGQELRIDSKKLVPGDLVLLHEGDRIPADGIIIRGQRLELDESLLTGESLTIQKTVEEKVYSGTLISSGHGLMCVIKTGARTEVGKIGISLHEVSDYQDLSLKSEINKVVKLFGWAGAIVCFAIVILYWLAYKNLSEAFLVGLSTQLALLPEEFPVVLSIFMAMGAWRLSKVNVLVRKPTAIERLGAIDTLCVDKTGTLTQNRMSVVDMSDTQNNYPDIIDVASLASRSTLFDPMEKAITQAAQERNLIHNWKLIKEYSLESDFFAMTCVWESESKEYLIAMKGSPETVLNNCKLVESEKTKIKNLVNLYANQGYRILGVAKTSYEKANLPAHQRDFQFNWVGLLALEDPIRPEVFAAVGLCKSAGIRVIMMTGDHPNTALNIANQAGLTNSHSIVMTGDELNRISDDELQSQIKNVNVFARLVPEQKLKIVKLLQKLNFVVGMTGDGVNDAPSLKFANVGIAMGNRGTDVAREASDIVLIDDNFASIVAGIQRGRTIFSNIKKAMGYITAVHVPIAGLAILPLILGWPIILFPIHIVVLQLIIDPTCTLLFETQKLNPLLMKAPPRSLQVKLFSSRDLVKSFLRGSIILIICLLTFWIARSKFDLASEVARNLTFAILIISNIALIFVFLKESFLRRNHALI